MSEARGHREFQSRTSPFTPDNLADARRTLEMFQRMHWWVGYAPMDTPTGPHKSP